MSDAQDLDHHELPKEVWLDYWNVRDGSGVGGVWHYPEPEGVIRKVRFVPADLAQMPDELVERVKAELDYWESKSHLHPVVSLLYDILAWHRTTTGEE